MFGLFKNMFRSKAPDRIHAVFGTLYAECTGDPEDRWHGEIRSPIGEGTIGICILAGAEGPCEGQMRFWEWFQGHIHEIITQVEPLLRTSYRDRCREELSEELLNEYRLCSVLIPIQGDPENTWDLAFTSKSDQGEHAFEVRFEGGKPTALHMDG